MQGFPENSDQPSDPPGESSGGPESDSAATEGTSSSGSPPTAGEQSTPGGDDTPASAGAPSGPVSAPLSEEPKPSRPRPPKVGPPTTFVRSLPDEVLDEILSGPGMQMVQKLLAAGLDLHLRESAVVGYWGGTVLAQIGRKPPSKKEEAEFPKGVLSCLVPRKLAEKVEFPKRSGLKGSQTCYRLDDEFFQAWDAQLDSLKEVCERADTKDGPLEFKFMTTNPGSAGVLPLDRQVQVPNNRAKLDAVAVEREGQQRILLVDLRNGVSADIAKAHVGLEAFYKEVTDEDGGLRKSISDEYKRMLVQRQKLGIPSAVDIDQVGPGTKVVCLVGLAHFRAESSVKDRLVEAASKLKWPLYLCEFAGSDGRVPKTSRWEGLGKVTEKSAPKETFGA